MLLERFVRTVALHVSDRSNGRRAETTTWGRPSTGDPTFLIGP